MVLSQMLHEMYGMTLLRYKELFKRQSWDLIEAIAILSGKTLFEKGEASIYFRSSEFAQQVFELAFEAIMAGTLKATQFRDNFYVTLYNFLEWWDGLGLALPQEIQEFCYKEELLSMPVPSKRSIVNAAKRQMRKIAKRVWPLNKHWTQDDVITYPEIKQIIDSLYSQGFRYQPKAHKEWISSCDLRPPEKRIGRPKKR